MSRLAALLLLAVIVAPIFAENWPCWRGPRLDGTSHDEKIPLVWSKTENVRWSVDVPGRGYSSPIVHGEHIFLSTCDEDKLERQLHCLDRKSGKTLWKDTVLTTSKLEKKHGLNSYSSSTPATDGEQVYVSFMGNDNTMQLACYDFKGKKLWQESPGKLLSVHGFCSSPILHKDLVIINGDQDDKGAFISARDKKTGKEKWRIDRPNKTRSYCTPILIPCPMRKGVTQMVLSGSKCVTGYDADTGKLLWIHDGPTQQYVASLVLHEGILFLTTGFPEFHLMGIRPTGEGNITKSQHIAWHIPHEANKAQGASYVPSPVAHNGHFFVVSDPGYLNCIEATTGKRVYQKKLGRRHSASIVLSQGHMIIPDDDGKVWVVKASPEFELVRTIDMGKSIFASPAVSDGQMFLRTLDKLYCIEKQ